MKLFYVLVLFLFSLPHLSSAQKAGLINSGDLIQKAGVLYDSSEYKSALNLLNKINRSDTNYVKAVYEKALSCEADSQYTQAVKYCQEGLALKEQREFEPDIYNTYGNTLSDMKKYDEALKMFDAAIAKFPHYALLYFNKGIVYTLLERPRDAELQFQKALLINPYMYSAHYQVSLAAIQQGKLMPAFLSSLGYLLTSPEGRYYPKAIAILSQITKSADEVLALKNKRTETPDANYQMIEEIVLSKIALDQQYKPIIALDDPISRQIQVVFEKLEYDAGNKDFYIQYYLPYFKQIYKDGQFEPFVNHIFSNAKLKPIQDYNSKNKKTIETFTTGAADYFNLIRATRELAYPKRDTITRKYVYQDGKLVGKGLLSKDGKMLTGFWEFFYAEGILKGKGNYNAAGNREGDWRFYRRTGMVSSKEIYLNGKLNGTQEYFYDNGNPSSVEHEENDQLDGIVNTFYYNGSKKSEGHYKVGKKNGEEKLYYDNGNIKDITTYVAGAAAGLSKEYYKSGGVKTVAQYADGKADGPYKSYYETGPLSAEMVFVKDKVEGEWKSYYENGKPKQKRNYINNDEVGLHQQFYENGAPAVTYTAKKDKINGEAIYYSKAGKPYAKFLYDNGIAKQTQYFDAAGKQIYTSALKGKVLDAVSFTPGGIKKEHYFYDEKGDFTGPDTLFYPSGKIHQINSYTAGELNGLLVTYYLNGKKKSEINMTAGKEDGYYQSFYVNGQPQTEGWMVAGDYQGEWLNYDLAGKITSNTYYLDGELNGYKQEYAPNGKKTIEQKYISGVLAGMTQYDEAENVIAVDSFPKASGKYTLLYPDKKVKAQGNLVNGSLHGPYKNLYFDGSPEITLFYKRGLLDSTYTAFFYGGLKRVEGRYIGGNKTGKWKTYEDDGKLLRTTTYTNDEINGELVYYNPDGSKDFVATYKDGELDGLWQKYAADGSMAYQIMFDEGDIESYSYNGTDGKPLPFISVAVVNGQFKALYANGKTARECTYSDGKKNGKMTIYYSNGQVRSVDNSVFGINEGASLEYYPNGKLMEDYNYVADNLNGVAKDYYPNGKLKRESTYVLGVNHGPVKYYDESGKVVKTLLYNNDNLVSVK